jgi:RNA polymerase sigma factor (sigma-70 family)
MNSPNVEWGTKARRNPREVISVAGLSDEALLERFVRQRDDMAFTALVSRHGPMVRRVCRSILSEPHDAEDAFQATFLVLARRAAMIRDPNRLSNWLFGAAYRVARKIRACASARRRHEANAARVDACAGDALGARELTEAVFEEVHRLPDRWRAAVVLCALEGLSQPEAAQQLGCSDRTLRRYWSRALELLRARLTRRGFAPAALALLVPESNAMSMPEGSLVALLRAAPAFAARRSACGAVSSSALIVAERVAQTLMWARLRAIAAGALFMSVLVAGVGLGVASAGSGRDEEPSRQNAPEAVVKTEPSPAEQYRALVKRNDDAVARYQKEAAQAKSPDDASVLWVRFGPKLGELAPEFVRLAERYPRDPAASAALLWVLYETERASDARDEPFGHSVGRAMEILARDHAGDRRLGPLSLKLTRYPSPRRDTFLRTLATTSPDRVVQGQARAALAEYLKMKGELVASMKRSDPALDPRALKEMYGPAYLKVLQESDPEPMLRESRELFEQVQARFADVPYARPDTRATRETLGDIARQALRPGKQGVPEDELRALTDAYKAARQAADRASEAAGAGLAAALNAYVAAAPRWSDFGPKIWQIAVDSPRSPAAWDALLWLIGHTMPFFDSEEERAEILGKAVDALIRDHLDALGDGLATREVAEAFNFGSPMPAPHVDRLLRALYERGRTREVRGRAGLLWGRHVKAEAALVERYAAGGSDPARKLELSLWAPSYLEPLRRRGRDAIAHEAETILEKVRTEYGNVKHLNGMVMTDETLDTVAGRDLAELRTIAVGKTAPDIVGQDADGRKMSLAEFRGKVVLLDFGSHQHCGACRRTYPRLRQLNAQFRTRPFVILGINNNDSRDVLKKLEADGEITWRCWWDGDAHDDPGPITQRWNIAGYPTFILLDHRGVIRARDVFPDDGKVLDELIERLAKEAESDADRAEPSPGKPK